MIATGGYGRIYGSYTTNATINYGTGASLALDTGVVPLGNMEAVQFHPTALSPSGILITEGCRGDGGYLLDKNCIDSWSMQNRKNRNSRAAMLCRGI